MSTERRSGWAFHCHHGEMLEWCYDYDERVEFIREHKPAHEQEVRLRCFQLLSPEAVAEIPAPIRKAVDAYDKARDAYDKSRAKARDAYVKAVDAYDEAYVKAVDAYDKARDAYDKSRDAYLWTLTAAMNSSASEAFHAKWCGCSDWNGETLVFPEGDASEG